MRTTIIFVVKMLVILLSLSIIWFLPALLVNAEEDPDVTASWEIGNNGKGLICIDQNQKEVPEIHCEGSLSISDYR